MKITCHQHQARLARALAKLNDWRTFCIVTEEEKLVQYANKRAEIHIISQYCFRVDSQTDFKSCFAF